MARHVTNDGADSVALLDGVVDHPAADVASGAGAVEPSSSQCEMKVSRRLRRWSRELRTEQ